jgi:hypothetical protein
MIGFIFIYSSKFKNRLSSKKGHERQKRLLGRDERSTLSVLKVEISSGGVIYSLHLSFRFYGWISNWILRYNDANENRNFKGKKYICLCQSVTFQRDL